MAGLDTLYLFPVYQTREQYKAATGQDAPAWTPNAPTKSWFDPNPPPADEDGFVQYLMVGLGPDGKTPGVKDGKPYLRLTRILRTFAMTVNIGQKAFDGSVQDPGSLSQFADYEVPVPCRPLAQDEELHFGWGGLVSVRKKFEAPPAGGGTATAAPDPELKKIMLEVLSKLDILLAMRS